MTGLELSKRFYEEYGKPMLENDFADIMEYLCVGLTGSGSECYGFDDDISQDHDFEPGFCIFIPGEDVVDRKMAFNLERAYAKLPKEFEGYKRSPMSPVGGNRHGVIRIDEYFEKAIGSPDGEFSVREWMTLPSYALCEAVNGEIFFDNYGLVTKIREKIKDMPSDVLKKRLAGNLLIMAQSGQYNYMRCINHKEIGAAQLALDEFVKSAMQVAFLLNKQYMPYYKWSFRAMRNLPLLSDIVDTLEYLLVEGNSFETAEEKYFLVEDIATKVIDVLMDQDLTKATCGDLEKHAYSVDDSITDGEIRNLNILCAV